MTANPFLGCSSQRVVPEAPAVIGCPLDLTSTYRTGTGEAPSRIRLSSDSIETYSPLFDRDITDQPCSDVGDVDLAGLSLSDALDLVQANVTEILRGGGVPLCLGGEHTITLAAVKALKTFHTDFFVVHLDAHADLRESYDGTPINHATVIRHVTEVVGPKRLIQLGIRSGTREEFAWMKRHGARMRWEPGDEQTLLRRIGGLPAYVTLDLDVLDPACLPGTGNPEAGGWFYHDMERFLRTLESVRVVAADVVELNPRLDRSEVSTITAAKIVRELLLVLSSPRSHAETAI